MTSEASIERGLWAVFAVLFGSIVAAAFLPARPVVAVLPAWGLVVLAACLGAVGAAVAAVRAGWGGEAA